VPRQQGFSLDLPGKEKLSLFIDAGDFAASAHGSLIVRCATEDFPQKSIRQSA
jgi:hypothetical protein